MVPEQGKVRLEMEDQKWSKGCTSGRQTGESLHRKDVTAIVYDTHIGEKSKKKWTKLKPLVTNQGNGATAIRTVGPGMEPLIKE